MSSDDECVYVCVCSEYKLQLHNFFSVKLKIGYSAGLRAANGQVCKNSIFPEDFGPTKITLIFIQLWSKPSRPKQANIS